MLAAALIAGFAMSSSACVAQRSTGPQSASARAATTFLTHLAHGRHDAAGDMVAPAVRTSFTEKVMRSLWSQLSSGASLESTRVDSEETVSGLVRTELTLTFGKPVRVRVVTDAQHRIMGIFAIPMARPTPTYNVPAYVDTTKFDEIALKVGGRGVSLPATLTLPRGVDRPPVIVLVHGSGPNDRDELTGPNRPFRDLAWGLATAGVAVLRYDKRTYVRAASVGVNFSVEEEVIEDALSALDSVRAHPRVNGTRVFVLGHSLGGMLTPEIAARDRYVAGAVVLAGSPRTLAQLILDQYEYLAGLPANASQEAQTGIATARVQLERLIRGEPAATENVMGVQASYFYDLNQRDALAYARRLEIPVLYLQGGRDYQVRAKDLDLWREGMRDRPAASFKLYPDLNHLFMRGTGMATPAEYDLPNHVAPEVVSDIAAFVLGATRTGHSLRRASSGSAAAAREPGIRHARSATPNITTTPTRYVAPSNHRTP
jgi:dienelactone hydrolase